MARSLSNARPGASILSISDLGGRHRAQVTLASLPTAAFYFLPRVIEAFNTRFPGIRFRIMDLSANEGLDAVANGEVEFGINIIGALRVAIIPWRQRLHCRGRPFKDIH